MFPNQSYHVSVGPGHRGWSRAVVKVHQNVSRNLRLIGYIFRCRRRIRERLWLNLKRNFKFLCLGSVNNNFISYLTGVQKNQVKDFVRASLYYLMILTFINMFLTYTFIHFYINSKHSKTIKIAERTNKAHFKENFISFKKLLISCMIVGFIVFGNFQVYNLNLVDEINVIPPMVLIVNFMSLFLSISFLLTKKSVLSYVKRRLTILVTNNFK